jgi:uncharacterized phage-associated protein
MHLQPQPAEPYHEPMTASARDVAAALRDRLPGLSGTKLHKLLYYCQGHHLAAFGVPLFSEEIAAWDLGPVVAKLWREEKHDPPAADDETIPPGRDLGEAELNTIGYVVSRYGPMAASDLIRLTHGEDPWKVADGIRKVAGDKSATIEPEWIRTFFKAKEAEDEQQRPQVDKSALARLLAKGHAQRDKPVRMDSREEIWRG